VHSQRCELLLRRACEGPRGFQTLCRPGNARIKATLPTHSALLTASHGLPGEKARPSLCSAGSDPTPWTQGLKSIGGHTHTRSNMRTRGVGILLDRRITGARIPAPASKSETPRFQVVGGTHTLTEPEEGLEGCQETVLQLWTIALVRCCDRDAGGWNGARGGHLRRVPRAGSAGAPAVPECTGREPGPRGAKSPIAVS
jgi:hypothetical protein